MRSLYTNLSISKTGIVSTLNAWCIQFQPPNQRRPNPIRGVQSKTCKDRRQGSLQSRVRCPPSYLSPTPPIIEQLFLFVPPPVRFLRRWRPVVPLQTILTSVLPVYSCVLCFGGGLSCETVLFFVKCTSAFTLSCG